MNLYKRLVVLSFLSLSVFAVQAKFVEAKIEVEVEEEKTLKELEKELAILKVIEDVDSSEGKNLDQKYLELFTKIAQLSQDKIKSLKSRIECLEMRIEYWRNKSNSGIEGSFKRNWYIWKASCAVAVIWGSLAGMMYYFHSNKLF